LPRILGFEVLAYGEEAVGTAPATLSQDIRPSSDGEHSSISDNKQPAQACHLVNVRGIDLLVLEDANIPNGV
jgi:hypothetical protein